MFVVREQASAHDDESATHANAGAGAEMDRLLREWGYAHGPAKK